MNKKYIVRLSEQERQACTEVIKKLKGSSQKVRRAQRLLKADADGPAWPDVRLADACTCRVQTMENFRKRLVTAGCALVLEVVIRASGHREHLDVGRTAFWVSASDRAAAADQSGLGVGGGALA